MKITFSNLGKIKKTTLDLRPLTVIIGPNNSNKTYIAYSVYGIWQSVLNSLNAPIIDITPIIDFDCIKWTKNILSVDITPKLLGEITASYNQKIIRFRENLGYFFQDSSNKLFTKTKFDIEISKKDIQSALAKFTNTKYELSESHFKFRVEKNVIQGELLKAPDNPKDVSAIEVEFILTITWKITNILFNNPLIFPAERNALVLTYKLLVLGLLNSFRNQRMKWVLPSKIINNWYSADTLGATAPLISTNYPKPIEDFLNFLYTIEFQKDKTSKTFHSLADKIEKNIQSKNKTEFGLTLVGGKEIKINVKKGLDIDLYNASSSIKQLAPLLLYLRYRAKENDLLIIDEPEMNLHPESQAKLLEVLGMLVNAGVNVLLTTHSPYFMSHLNNLISGDTENEKNLEAQAKSLYLKDKRAFLKPEDVSAYEMKNDKLKNLKHKDYGIRWDTLSDVSADIQQKFFEIYEKGDNSRNGEEK